MKKAPEPQEEYIGDFGGKPETEESGTHAAQEREAQAEQEAPKEVG